MQSQVTRTTFVHEAARRNERGNIKFLCGDAEHVNLPGASFDLIYGTGIVHHLNTERCAKEIAHLLCALPVQQKGVQTRFAAMPIPQASKSAVKL